MCLEHVFWQLVKRTSFLEATQDMKFEDICWKCHNPNRNKSNFFFFVDIVLQTQQGPYECESNLVSSDLKPFTIHEIEKNNSSNWMDI